MLAKRSRTAPTRAPIDLSFANSATLLVRQTRRVDIVLVGCGGTGSWLAPSIARLAYELRSTGREVLITFVDPDTVEAANVPRQNFCQPEIGRYKAVTLAARYGAAWGLEIAAIPERFESRVIEQGYDRTAIVIGCVDNAVARRALADTLRRNWFGPEDHTHCWLLDCGNERESGQVLLGSAPKPDDLRWAFASLPGKCTALPSPALQHPELLEPRPEELADSRLSCAELAAANAQSLMVNQQVAAIAADYLVRLTLSHDLRRFATYFDLPSGSARSKYITPATVAASVGQSPSALFKRERRRRGEEAV